MADVSLVQLAVEGLLLEQPLAGVRTDRDAHVAEHRRRLPRRPRAAPSATRSRAQSGVLRRHPVQEHAVGLRSRQARTSSGPWRRRHHARSPGSAARIAASPSRTTPSGRLVKPAPIPSHSRAGSRPSSPIFAATSGGLMAVERQHGDAHARAPALRARTRRSSRARSPSDGRWTTTSRSRARRSAPRARGRPPAPGPPRRRTRAAAPVRPSPRSNSATHSMCGVWGNMSTGRTLTRRKPASTIWRAFGASVVGLQET